MSEKQLERIEAMLIAERERKSLGHRIVYDTKSGWSINVFGLHCDPALLDEHGYQIRG